MHDSDLHTVLTRALRVIVKRGRYTTIRQVRQEQGRDSDREGAGERAAQRVAPGVVICDRWIGVNDDARAWMHTMSMHVCMCRENTYLLII